MLPSSRRTSELWLTTIKTCNRWSALFEIHLGFDKKKKKEKSHCNRYVGFQNIIIVKICWRETYGNKIVIQKALCEPNATAV